jgi:hypothetical protein
MALAAMIAHHSHLVNQEIALLMVFSSAFIKMIPLIVATKSFARGRSHHVSMRNRLVAIRAIKPE